MVSRLALNEHLQAFKEKETGEGQRDGLGWDCKEHLK
jgi:hypothetical protein